MSHPLGPSMRTYRTVAEMLLGWGCESRGPPHGSPVTSHDHVHRAITQSLAHLEEKFQPLGSPSLGRSLPRMFHEPHFHGPAPVILETQRSSENGTFVRWHAFQCLSALCIWLWPGARTGYFCFLLKGSFVFQRISSPHQGFPARTMTSAHSPDTGPFAEHGLAHT